MQDISHLICNQAGCLLSSTGDCLEGIDDPHRCPHAKPDGAQTGSEAAISTDAEGGPEDVSDWLPILGGYELTITEATGITAASETRVVMFAGEPDAGKTTLIATIYELFSGGELPEFRFAGTETILAFERAVFPSRIASKNVKPDTIRTRHPKARFYHLCLRPTNSDGARKHLLLGDVSGETFKRASDDDAEARKLHILRRVDAFVLILDGDKLRSRIERQDVVERALLILRSLVEAEVLLPHSLVQVLISKFDCFDENSENDKEFLEHLRTQFLGRFSKVLPHLTIHEVAARPENDRFNFGHGVREIILPWLADSEFSWTAEYPARSPERVFRECEAYLWRVGIGRDHA